MNSWPPGKPREPHDHRQHVNDRAELHAQEQNELLGMLSGLGHWPPSNESEWIQVLNKAEYGRRDIAELLGTLGYHGECELPDYAIDNLDLSITPDLMRRLEARYEPRHPYIMREERFKKLYGETGFARIDVAIDIIETMDRYELGKLIKKKGGREKAIQSIVKKIEYLRSKEKKKATPKGRPKKT
ncbi:MAG: hypothetical protein ACE361_19375 [Aureliella sp.]